MNASHVWCRCIGEGSHKKRGLKENFWAGEVQKGNRVNGKPRYQLTHKKCKL
jgi:hypothetical protein